ncbi:unnamed protein product [Paramecium primaurelia]|uniref:Thioredoxin domain-containing protein n=1 Tax=Paramecium primaurelia TaxID=5886 RepID=A0A8S1QJD7_PARPR|nr:unnamed protein product [Paramecium primaurelia]
MDQVIQVTTSNYSEKPQYLLETFQLKLVNHDAQIEAEPTIKNYAIPQLLQKAYTIYWCWAGDKETWKDPNNPARISDWIQIKSIPTLLLVHDNKEAIRFEEEQLFNENALKQFLEQ